MDMRNWTRPRRTRQLSFNVTTYHALRELINMRNEGGILGMEKFINGLRS